MAKWITKSRFLKGKQCMKALYLDAHHRDLGTPPDFSKQRVFDTGKEVGVFARTKFPGGVLIDGDLFESIDLTKDAIREKVPAIFEGAFLYSNVYVRVDVLENVGDKGWNIYEVKQSTKYKSEEHLPDLAVQVWTLQKSGLKLNKVFLRHINNRTFYPELAEIFQDFDATEEVEACLAKLQDELSAQAEVLKRVAPPRVDIGPQCEKPYECDFKNHCWQSVPEGSVFDLNDFRPKIKKYEFFHDGREMLTDLNEDDVRTPLNKAQVIAAKTGNEVIDRNGLKTFLEKLKYPLYYLDFETIRHPLPYVKGMRPYQQVPVQYSLIIVDFPGAEPRENHFIAEDLDDPWADTARNLHDVLSDGKIGSLVAYNVKFEIGCIREMAAMFPQFARKFDTLISKPWDLWDAFKYFYYHPAFGASLSLKSVLPVLIPTLSYDGLEIHTGNEATVALERLFKEKLSGADVDQIRSDLVAYCRLDTIAMISLHGRLQELISVVD